ncbi:MAG: YbjQ family protein [Lachnospiraceae bacterium]
MILVNTDYIEGRKFEMIGLVKGSMIQSVHVGKDIVNQLQTLVGGELTSYTEMMNEARNCYKTMSEEAAMMGADAIVNIRYTSSQVVQSAAEIMAYGTAVKFIDER